MDERVKQVEKSVSLLCSGQNQIMENMNELFGQLSVRLDDLTNKANTWEIGDNSIAPTRGNNRQTSSNMHTQSNSVFTPNKVKLNFTPFNGKKDLARRLCRVEAFFSLHEASVSEWVSIAAFHLA
ncbi:Organic solute transporter Ost-alpha [Quillaja saponaria]|uniref:Organic solute transporter Ost-alpha n=1 Tax=Quillaja saponaria TaxID=32244 RepID=A0AAD7PMA5_QUISA|nr:Organic solute transporter Ost-alpha [Quillaja saponaria]